MKRTVREELMSQRRFRSLIFILFFLVLVLGLVITPIERGESMFKTTEDGLWWATTTVSDYAPVTSLGRIIGVILQAAGVVVVGLVVGLMTMTLTKRQQEMFWYRETERFAILNKRLDELERKLEFLVKSDVNSMPQIRENTEPPQV
jgi:lysylphosphatidylglycerol synthetase-like protein (DUF2156 family)